MGIALFVASLWDYDVAGTNIDLMLRKMRTHCDDSLCAPATVSTTDITLNYCNIL
jgi:hypothetical protein